MDSELKAIQQVRSVLTRQQLNQDQQLRVLQYVVEGIYRAHALKNIREVHGAAQPPLDEPARTQQRMQLADADQLANADPMAQSNYSRG